MSKLSERGLAHATMVFLVIAWGFDYVAAKWALEVLPAGSLMFFKFSLGFVFVLLIKFALRKKWFLRKKDIPIFILCAIFGQVCYYECEYNAMALMPVALISIVLAFVPAVSIILERIIYKRRANSKIYAGIVLCLVGIAFVVGADFSIITQGRGTGYLLAVGAVFCWNIYNFITAGLKGYDSLILSLNQLACATLLLLPGAFRSMPPASEFTLPVVFGILWIGLVDSGLGYLIVVFALQKLGPTTNAVYSNFLPVTTAFFGAVLLGEHLTWLQILGGIIVIAAGFLVIWEKGKIDEQDEQEEQEEQP